MEQIKRNIQGLFKYRYLIGLRIRHEIRAKYKNSFLGILWSLLNPLLQMIVLSIVFSTLFKNSIENFPVYIVTGRLLFNYFAEGTNGSIKAITSGASLIQKVYFPRYILVISKITSNFVILLITMIDLVLVMIFTKAPITIYLLYAPLYLGTLYVFVVGCGLILATLNVFFRDMEHLYSVIVMIIMYFSAIFYPVSIIPESYQKLLFFNPVFHYIEGFRYATYYGLPPDLGNLTYCIGAAMIALVIGIIAFKRNQDKFILYI